MEKVDDNKMKLIMFEIIGLERKNLKTRAKSDVKMVEEISKVIQDYTKQRF